MIKCDATLMCSQLSNFQLLYTYARKWNGFGSLFAYLYIGLGWYVANLVLFK